MGVLISSISPRERSTAISMPERDSLFAAPRLSANLYRRKLALNFRPRKAGIIFMSLTLVLGVSIKDQDTKETETNYREAHRALIVRKLKGLEDIISFTSVHWHLQLDKSMLNLQPLHLSIY